MKTRSIVVDFGQLVTIADYKEKIADKLKDIDIAMLFLNAGYLPVGPFADMSYMDIQRTVGCNALHPIYLAKVLVDQLLARNHLTALVITSSGLGIIPAPGVITYSASKSFASFLAIGLSYELEGKVDCMSWTLGMTDTKLLSMPNKKTNPLIATRKEAVDGMLRDIGRQN